MTKRKNTDNLLVDLQKLLKQYDAELIGLNNCIGVRIFNEMTLPIESVVVWKITGETIVKTID